jgi:pilus assembly protein CpaB
MNRRRRAALLLGLALVLGALAASDVARREAALEDQLGPLVDVVVASRPLAPGRRLDDPDLAIRRVPERFAVRGVPVLPELLLGRRLAVPVPQGAQVTEHQLAEQESTPGPGVRRGERAVEVLATATPELVREGARVDVVVTGPGGRPGQGTTELALEDVEVLASRPAAAEGPGRKVEALLRVSVRQAVYLAAAGSFAREIRLLARPYRDRDPVGPIAVGDDLRHLPLLPPP